MRIRVETPIDDIIDRLLNQGMVILDDGVQSKKVTRAMSELRRYKHLSVGRDRRFGQSILVVNPNLRFKRRRTLRGSIFNILL